MPLPPPRRPSRVAVFVWVVRPPMNCKICPMLILREKNFPIKFETFGKTLYLLRFYEQEGYWVR